MRGAHNWLALGGIKVMFAMLRVIFSVTFISYRDGFSKVAKQGGGKDGLAAGRWRMAAQ
jgi:hypothetical protein